MIDQPIPDPRQTRHLATLEELATLAMALTRAAAERAQRHLEDPAPEPASDPVLTFTRLATTVRQLIALEARLARPTPQTSTPHTPTGQPSKGPKPVDDAREFLAEAVRACAKADPAAIRRHGPTRTHIERHIDECIERDDDVAAMIDANRFAADIVQVICIKLDIRFDIAQQPDKTLVLINEAVDRRREAQTPKPTPTFHKPASPLPPREGPGVGGQGSALDPTNSRSRDPT